MAILIKEEAFSDGFIVLKLTHHGQGWLSRPVVNASLGVAREKTLATLGDGESHQRRLEMRRFLIIMHFAILSGKFLNLTPRRHIQMAGTSTEANVSHRLLESM